MNSTKNRKMNGLSAQYSNSIVIMAPASLTARLCARLDAIVALHKSGDLSKDRFKGGLDCLTWAAVDSAKEIAGEKGGTKILEHFGNIFDSTYDEKYLQSLMHGTKSPTAYSDLIGAFGETAGITKHTLGVLTAAKAFDNEHGIQPRRAGQAG